MSVEALVEVLLDTGCDPRALPRILQAARAAYEKPRSQSAVRMERMRARRKAAAQGALFDESGSVTCDATCDVTGDATPSPSVPPKRYNQTPLPSPPQKTEKQKPAAPEASLFVFEKTRENRAVAEAEGYDEVGLERAWCDFSDHHRGTQLDPHRLEGKFNIWLRDPKNRTRAMAHTKVATAKSRPVGASASPLPPAAPVKSALVEVVEDTPQGDAWNEHCRKTRGAGAPWRAAPDNPGKRVWNFPTEWPPGFDPATAKLRSNEPKVTTDLIATVAQHMSARPRPQAKPQKPLIREETLEEMAERLKNRPPPMLSASARRTLI